MNKRNKLLNALNGLELSFKKKEEFVDTLLNNSSGGSESGGDWHYFDVSNFSSLELQNNSISIFSMLIKKQDNRVVGGGAVYNMDERIIAFATDYNTKISFDTSTGGHEFITIADMLSKTLDAAGDATLLELLYAMGMTEITKEEFYHFPEDTIIKYRDYNKLKEVFDKLENELTKKGVMEDLPVDIYWYNAPKLNIPTFELGYNSISAEINANGDVYGNNIIGRVWKQTEEFSTTDWWFESDNDKELEFTNVDATYIEILNQGFALCKIVFADKSDKYILRMLA